MSWRGNKIKGLIPAALVLLAFMLFASSLLAAGPGTITYQGTVTDSGGVTPPDSTYQMRFTLFDALSAGSLKWQETHTGIDAVQLTNGTYAVELGGVTSFPANLFTDEANLWLEIEVDLNGNGFEPAEIYSPRVPFTAAPYAFQSDRATTAVQALDADTVDGQHASGFSPAGHSHNLQDLPGAVTDSQVPDDITINFAASAGDADTVDGQHASNLTPVGTVLLYAGSSAPDGWLLCNGDAYSTSTYPALFSVIGYTYGGAAGTFLVPDMQGRGPMGYDSGDTDFDALGETGGAKNHTLTISQMPSHQHEVVVSDDGWPDGSDDRINNYYWIDEWRSPDETGDHLTAPAGGNQPHNNLQPYIVLNFIIKY